MTQIRIDNCRHVPICRLPEKFAKRYSSQQFSCELKMQILKSALLYFALVFGAGFLLGTIRVLLVVPRLGVRTAELIEMPVMMLVSFLVARWIILRFPVLPSTTERIAIGIVALVLLLGTEFTFIWLQGRTISEYVAGRDPVAGTAYLIALGVFAFMPLVVARRG
jgi:hypothetical protein